jgi:hypothetical protein
MEINVEKLKEFGRSMASILPLDYWGTIEFRFAGSFCIGIEPKPYVKIDNPKAGKQGG